MYPYSNAKASFQNAKIVQCPFPLKLIKKGPMKGGGLEGERWGTDFYHPRVNDALYTIIATPPKKTL